MSAIPGLVALAQQKVEFMRHVGVLKLSAVDTIVLEQEEKEKPEEEEDSDLHSLLLRATVHRLWSSYSLLEQIPTVPQRIGTLLSSLPVGMSPLTLLTCFLLLMLL